MSSIGASMMIRKGNSWSEKIIRLSLYGIISGMIAFYGHDGLDNWLTNFTDLPISNEILIIFVSLILGIFITTVLLMLFKRNVRRGMIHV